MTQFLFQYHVSVCRGPSFTLLNIILRLSNKETASKFLRTTITSSTGFFRPFRVTLNLIPSFSSCLDRTRISVAELLKSSSSLLIFSIKFTSNTPFAVSGKIRFHCRLRIQAPIATPATRNKTAPTKIPSPNTAKNTLLDLAFAQFRAKPTEPMNDVTRQNNSAAESKESISKSPSPPCLRPTPPDVETRGQN